MTGGAPINQNFVCYNNGVTDGPCSQGLSSVGSSTTISIDLTNYSTTAQGTQTIAIDNLVEYSTSNGDTVSIDSLVDTLNETLETPEPSTLFLAGAGLAAAWIRRRKSTAN
jgi:PEP-CTERM motif